MTEQPASGLPGIEIRNEGDRVVFEVAEGRWEGSAAEAEQLLTHLHYVLNRARPGTNIAGVFAADKLFGGKIVTSDRREALAAMRRVAQQLADKMAELEAEEAPTP